MPWTGKSFASKHNKRLHGKAASHAADQANAILRETGNEGMAIAVANKHAMADGGLVGALGQASMPSDSPFAGGLDRVPNFPSNGSYMNDWSGDMPLSPHLLDEHGAPQPLGTDMGGASAKAIPSDVTTVESPHPEQQQSNTALQHLMNFLYHKGATQEQIDNAVRFHHHLFGTTQYMAAGGTVRMAPIRTAMSAPTANDPVIAHLMRHAPRPKSAPMPLRYREGGLVAQACNNTEEG